MLPFQFQRRFFRDACNSSNSSFTKRWRPNGRLYEKQRVYYCAFPKDGSTFRSSFLENILNLRCHSGVSCFKDLGKLNTSYDAHIRKLIEHSYSFMFVQEPYNRLFSAYENKLFLPNKFWRTLGSHIVRLRSYYMSRNFPNEKNFINKPLNVDIETTILRGSDVTFPDMLDYVVKMAEYGLSVNEHLKPMYSSCDPCQVKFGYIGKLESLTEDLQNITSILKRLYLTKLVSVNRTNYIAEKTRSNLLYEPIEKLFEITDKLHNNHTIYQLFLRTWSSYHIRGLLLKAQELPFTEEDKGKVVREDFFSAVTSAHVNSKNNKKSLQEQRREALIQAYESVPRQLLLKVKKYVSRDCKLFGYDDEPSHIFSGTSQTTQDFNYFKGIL